MNVQHQIDRSKANTLNIEGEYLELMQSDKIVEMSPAKPWFALQTRPRSEKKIVHLLRQKGYECFTPTYQQKRRWSDRTVESSLPLFPSYVFCQLDDSLIHKAISTVGVIRIVGFGGKPSAIDVNEINALRLVALSHLTREPWDYLPDGMPVIIKTGPLSGVRGTVCQGGNNKRLIISVTLLQRSIAVQLDRDTAVSLLPGHFS